MLKAHTFFFFFFFFFFFVFLALSLSRPMLRQVVLGRNLARQARAAGSGLELVVGLEVHAQLLTRSKLLSASATPPPASRPPANTLVSAFDLALPGALPVLNRAAVRLALRLARTLAADAQRVSRFERKHYCYRDLPHGFQVTQAREPVIRGGRVRIMQGSGWKDISIERVQVCGKRERERKKIIIIIMMMVKHFSSTVPNLAPVSWVPRLTFVSNTFFN
jgi:hypothetical protein